MPGPSGLPTTIVDDAKNVQPILQLISDATSTNWDSSDAIDSILTKAFAAIAIWHPGLSVAAWEPVILGASLAAVVLEQAFRQWRKSKSITGALSALQAGLTAARVIVPATTPVPVTTVTTAA